MGHLPLNGDQTHQILSLHSNQEDNTFRLLFCINVLAAGAWRFVCVCVFFFTKVPNSAAVDRIACGLTFDCMNEVMSVFLHGWLTYL
jgi:hypothetical protein